MIPIIAKNFRNVYTIISDYLRESANVIRTEKWQGVAASKPEMRMYEIENVSLEFPMGTTDLAYHRVQIGPNLPWADQHFEVDRVSGEPLNPGFTWEQWPWSNKANNFREIKHEGWKDQFNHTYAERYWPKYAGFEKDGIIVQGEGPIHKGIRYNYGDLNDLINLLSREPLTRQAYLPIFFPEDTGSVHGSRVPCTLGYLFRVRKNELSITYYIRSCDFIRHFKDDVYLTVRLALWMLEQCTQHNYEVWSKIKPGAFIMHIGSLHMFVNDFNQLFRSG